MFKHARLKGKKKMKLKRREKIPVLVPDIRKKKLEEEAVHLFMLYFENNKKNLVNKLDIPRRRVW